jgi:hypothetical protein
MPTMRRTAPEPRYSGPSVQVRPGLAAEMLRELAPLLAEEGIDVAALTGADADGEVPDLETLQAALNRAVERHNMALFTPVGPARDLALTTLRLAVEAITTGDDMLATAVLNQAEPESPDGTTPTVAGCIGVGLDVIDNFLGGPDPRAPKTVRGRVRLPAGHWSGERAAADILALAAKGRAFRSLDTLMIRQGGEQILHGVTIALAATVTAWSAQTGRAATEILHDTMT